MENDKKSNSSEETPVQEIKENAKEAPSPDAPVEGETENDGDHPVIKGRINEYKVDHVKGKQKVFFQIEIKYNGYEWTVARRYSEFEEIMKQLRFHFSNLPALPGKTFFALKKAREIEDRRKKLDDWLQHILKRDEFYANDKFSEFFELEEHASDKLLNKICLVGRLTHAAFGYRDILILQEENIMFSLTSQMDATTRMDSYLTNKIGGKVTNNGKDFKMSIGALECWAQKSAGSEEFTYQQIWSRAFKSQAICLHYCREHKLLLVGCDNGDIVPIKVNPETPDEFEELKEYRVHKARVMAIWMDPENKRIYSIGEDKKLICFNFKNKTINCGKPSRKICF